MRLSQSILTCALLLACAAGVSAAPQLPVAPADLPTASVTGATLPSDVFGSSVLSNTDCAAEGAKPASLAAGVCGACSPVACRGQFVDTGCGSGVGGQKYCRDWSGLLCSDGNARCQCTNSIPP